MRVLIESYQNAQCSLLRLGLYTCRQGAYADSCSPPKAPMVAMCASELAHGAIEAGGLVWWIMFSFLSCGWPGVTYLRNSWQQDALWEECKLAGSVMLRVMFCWETLGSPIHVDVVLTRCKPFHQNSTHWWLSPLCALPQSKRNGSRMVWILQQWLWDVDLTSKFSRSGQKSPIHGIPILKFKG